MTKQMRMARPVIGIALGILILWSVLIGIMFLSFRNQENLRRTGERFGIFVAGTPVAYQNAADVLGDGTVMYDPVASKLTLNNAVIEAEDCGIYSRVDLTVELVGENRLITRGGESTVAIYASNGMLRKDLAICGEGKLILEGNNGTGDHAAGIIADDLWIDGEVEIILSDLRGSAGGVDCAYLCLQEGAALSVQVGSGQENRGIFVRGDLQVEADGALSAVCDMAEAGSRGIECTGSILAGQGSSIRARSGADGADIFCHGCFVDLGAETDGTVDALGGIRDEARIAG